jgi:hypothetical protein
VLERQEPDEKKKKRSQSIALSLLLLLKNVQLLPLHSFFLSFLASLTFLFLPRKKGRKKMGGGEAGGDGDGSGKNQTALGGPKNENMLYIWSNSFPIRAQSIFLLDDTARFPCM